MPTADIQSQIAELAARIERHEDAEAEVAALVQQHGDWVKESLVDCLTAGSDDTYSQFTQDELAAKGLEMSSADSSRRLAVSPLETIEPGPSLLALLADLVPADLAAIRREAQLTPIEYDVWRYWLDGQDFATIVRWVTKRDGSSYAEYSIRLILKRAQGKIANCRSLGWRTCLAEDIARGKVRRIPRKATIGRVLKDMEED